MMQESPNLLVFSGNANKRLAQNICKELGVRPGKALVASPMVKCRWKSKRTSASRTCS
jgi:hypothetical protein